VFGGRLRFVERLFGGNVVLQCRPEALASHSIVVCLLCLCCAVQCKFDLYSPQSTAAVPPVLYSTMDGCFCVTQDAAAAAAAEAAMQGSSWADDSSSSSGGLVSRVLHKEAFSICSFDVEPTHGRSVLAATDNEHILVLQLDEHMHQM
jgi:hypothetical protein